MSEGKFIKEARIKAGLTQGEVAKKLKFHTQLISNIERHICSLPKRHIKKFISITGCERDEFRQVLMNDYRNELEQWF